MDHASNVYKDKKVALYEARGDMEHLPSGAVDPNPNAFSDAATRLSKAYNDAHPVWQVHGGDNRYGRFGYLPEKVARAPCGVTARRHHSTKTGPDIGHIIGGAPGGPESCRGMFSAVAGVIHKSAFWQAHKHFLNGLSCVISKNPRCKN